MRQREPLNLKENLKDKFVAYIDVMGFSNLVNRDSVADLESYFIRVIEVLDKIKVDKGQIESFLISDAIILIAPSGLKGLKDIILATRRIQSALLWKKILLRGAISYGQVFYDKKDNIIVGKGFIKAYLLEQEAIYPRVIVDPSIIRIIADDKEAFIQSIQKDSGDKYDDRLIYTKSQFSQIDDDCIFIDYANKSVLQLSLNENIKKVYETIVKNLYGEQKLYSKYVWLRDYFTEWLKLTKFNIEVRYREASFFDRTASPMRDKHYRMIADWLKKFERL
ncbi:hypothetical protein WSM22_30480 [Cytophagales bacterium WSM2-2]|nr:hypothetical protein WSM22_30480 [Cytophagales bacterium WSM2-2]